MVKVQDDDVAAMAESKTAAASSFQLTHNTNSTVTNNNNNNTTFNNTTHNIRKPRNPNHTHHLHQTFHHYTYYHHHCSYPSESAELANGTSNSANTSSPAKFYFGPGFEPQTQIPGGSFAPAPSQVQNKSDYVVLFHVNPGVTISFQIGDNMEILRGPVTVPMVSTNSSPPIAMPVQVPPGHMVQQIVDESGTLRHVILSPQHPAGLVPLPTHNPQHYAAGPANGTNQPQQYYQGLPTTTTTSTAFPTHFHSNMPPSGGGHQQVPSPTHHLLGHSPPPPPPPQLAATASHPAYYKDERAQKQHIKLKKKLHHKMQKGDNINVTSSTINPPSIRKELVVNNDLKRNTTIIAKEKGMNSVGTSEDGEESSSVPDEEDSIQIVADILSSVQAPKVSELSSRSALLQWAPPTRLSESASNDENLEIDISETDLRYEVLLSDKGKEMKFKSIYSGVSLSCRIQDLRPGQEYSVCLQVHLDELQGSATDPIRFTTPPCEPDQPQPPKLHRRCRNSLQLRWNPVNDNGSHLSHYILEYDEGKADGDFIEYHRGRAKQHNLQKLQPATFYRFRLCAVNDVGKSPYSDIVVYSTLCNAPLKPNPPVLVEATINSLHLKWNRRPQDDEFTLQMCVIRSDKNSMKSDDYLIIYTGEDAEHICSRLNCFTNYKFKLCAQNDGGTSPWSDEILFRTLPDRPARPSKPIVKGRIHAHSFKLKWEPPTDCGGAEITKYQLEVNSGSGYKTVYSGNETEAVCDKLTPGTTYQLRVSCISAGGTSNYSDPCTVTTDAISPGQCTMPQLFGNNKQVKSSNRVSIRWTEPDYNGGAPILEYEVEMISKNENNRSLIYKNRETECTITTLNPGCNYSFTVRAVNRIGAGIWSDYLDYVSGPAPPSTPSAPLVTCKSPFHVLVEWQEPSLCNGATIQEYKLDMSNSLVLLDTTNIDGQLFTTIYQGLETTYDVKGLNPFSTYVFRVQASNIAGYSQYSANTVTLTPAAPPSSIQQASIRHYATPTTIQLNWNEPHNNGSPITHYNIEIGDKIVAITSATEYMLESLHSDTHYKIKIQAVNNVGCGPFSSTIRTTTLKPPPQPPKLECTGAGYNYLKLKWGDGKNLNYTQYSLEVVQHNTRLHEFQCVYKGTAFTYKVNKLHELTTYTFRINASDDAGGVGDYSDEYQFTTGIATPVVLKQPKLVDVEERNCTIEWYPGRNPFNDLVIYQVQMCCLKGQVYKQVYKGPDTRCSVDDLDPGVEYSAKVCPIRIMSGEEELPGPYSSVLNFTTQSTEPPPVAIFNNNNKSFLTNNNNNNNSSILAANFSSSHSHKNRNLLYSLLQTIRPKSISDQPIFYAILITIFGIIIAIWIRSFI